MFYVVKKGMYFIHKPVPEIVYDTMITEEGDTLFLMYQGVWTWRNSIGYAPYEDENINEQ